MRWNDITQRFEASTFGSDLMASTYNLYNGNIKAMVTTIVKPTITPGDTVQFEALPQGTAYKYDQLNRLTEMTAWQNVNSSTNVWQNGLVYNGRYHNKFEYDANGNILSQLRNDGYGNAINYLTYKRQLDASNDLMRNRLYHVRDSVSSGAFADDIDDQGYYSNHADSVNISNNYSYDAIGNLTKNTQKEIDTILYSVYGKVKEVIRTSGSSKKNLKFDYDANGNRTAKHIFDSYNNWEKSEYYVLDAQGNVMSIYENKVDTAMHYAQTEKHIFGSSRLGADKTSLEMIGAVAVADGDIMEHALGYKHFDASNHLGNTLITFTDRKIPVDLNTDNVIDEYWPDVIASNDYYPFGVKMKERTFSSENSRYQFNGKQFDEETETSDFGARMLDGDLALWGAIDKIVHEFLGWSPYSYAVNNPLFFTDPDGRDIKPSTNIKTSSSGTYGKPTSIHHLATTENIRDVEYKVVLSKSGHIDIEIKIDITLSSLLGPGPTKFNLENPGRREHVLSHEYKHRDQIVKAFEQPLTIVFDGKTYKDLPIDKIADNVFQSEKAKFEANLKAGVYKNEKEVKDAQQNIIKKVQQVTDIAVGEIIKKSDAKYADKRTEAEKKEGKLSPIEEEAVAETTKEYKAAKKAEPTAPVKVDGKILEQ
jgi:RHS repeat-associated protein